MRDPDNPPLTAAELATFKPFPGDLPPAVADAIREAHRTGVIRRARGPQKAPTKQLVSLRLSRTVLAAYRRTGRGWQARLNDDLERAAARLPSPRKRAR